ncbi:MAG: adenylate/guanylate cyclase domain-containing protein [Chloroflexota bacterium]
MKSTLTRRFLSFIGRIGAEDLDTDDIRLRKALMVAGAFMFILAGTLWGLLYFAFGHWAAGWIPLGYAIISSFSILQFALTRRYQFFRSSQLILILLLPFILMIALGGFINSSAVILWSLLSPVGALLFDEPRHAARWLIAYLALVTLSGLIQPYVPASQPLPIGIITFFFVMNIGSVSAIIIVLLAYFVNQRNIFQEKADNLLLNILPKEIAAILKNESRTIADHYDEASILFADMVNFTPMSAEMSPVAMVDLLNEIFSHFDGLVEKYDLEKIKTVGDCYMVAAGVPRPRADHGRVLLYLALEMREFIQNHTFNASRPVGFRMGINSGPVLAGVIGRKKFIYDLWGDAVNIASRMESHGQGGVIQITRATYELIKNEFLCEPRGTIDIKGRGEMEVWHVVGPAPRN